MQARVQRSIFVTVVAWIFIVFSGLTTAISILQNLMVWLMFRPRMSTPGQDAVTLSSWLAQHIELFFASFLVASTITLAASIGLLKRRNWARVIFIALLSIGIAWFLVSVPLQWATMSGGPALEGPDMAPFRTMQIVMGVFSAVLGLAIVAAFAWIIRKLVSPAIREEFAMAQGARL